MMEKGKVLAAVVAGCAVGFLCGVLLRGSVGETDGHTASAVGGRGEAVVEVRIDTCWVRDTIRTAGPVVVREEVREVPAMVDTDAILADFFTARTVSDTLQLRDVATVRITDTVFRNDIVGRHVDYDLALLQPTVTVSNIQRARLALSVGVQIGREEAALMAGFRYKRAELLGGYDFRQKSPSVTIKYDIKQWQ